MTFKKTNGPHWNPGYTTYEVIRLGVRRTPGTRSTDKRLIWREGCSTRDEAQFWADHYNRAARVHGIPVEDIFYMVVRRNHSPYRTIAEYVLTSDD